jgi:hypothetical protein
MLQQMIIGQWLGLWRRLLTPLEADWVYAASANS